MKMWMREIELCTWEEGHPKGWLERYGVDCAEEGVEEGVDVVVAVAFSQSTTKKGCRFLLYTWGPRIGLRVHLR